VSVEEGSAHVLIGCGWCPLIRSPDLFFLSPVFPFPHAHITLPLHCTLVTPLSSFDPWMQLWQTYHLSLCLDPSTTFSFCSLLPPFRSHLHSSSLSLSHCHKLSSLSASTSPSSLHRSLMNIRENKPLTSPRIQQNKKRREWNNASLLWRHTFFLAFWYCCRFIAVVMMLMLPWAHMEYRKEIRDLTKEKDK
jgi:hypothetical protein